MIIIAALINAGLLVVLFVTAVKPGNPEDKTAVTTRESKAKVETVASKPVSAPSKGDQIDQVISAYSAKTAEKEKLETKTLPLPILTPEPRVVKTAIASKVPLKAELAMDQVVTVEKGDVLDKIARKNGVSTEALMKINHLSSTQLQIGQVLKLPEKSVTKVANKKPAEEDKYYTVKGGDNPWTIAHKNGMQVDELLDLNHMNEEKAKRLRPGDKLKIK